VHHSGTSVSAKIGVGVGAGVGGLLLLILLVWVVALRRKLRRERNQNKPSADIASTGIDSGLVPVATTSMYPKTMSQRLSAVPTPPAGPSPPEIQHGNYAPWGPYGHPGAQEPYQPTYQQSQPRQSWQQAPMTAPYEAGGQPVAPQRMSGVPAAYHGGSYPELAGTQIGVYEADANQPRLGVSNMSGGSIYTRPVERGPSDTPRLAHSVQSSQPRNPSVNF
jgi:hypothetical protein